MTSRQLPGTRIGRSPAGSAYRSSAEPLADHPGKDQIHVTDTQEQTLPVAVEPTDAPAANGTAGRTRAKRGSLSSMLLPELQQLAAGLGLRTTKMKKSDLVAAIQAVQGGAQGSNGS